MCKKLGVLLLVFSVNMGFAVEKPYEKLLKASKVLVVNSGDQTSFDILKENMDLFKEVTVKASLVRVMGLALLNSDKSKLKSFKSEMKSKYPSVDFSFADENIADYTQALQKSVNNLVLNASSAFEAQKGNSPSAVMVNPRKDSVESFMPESENETVGKANMELAKVDTQEVVRDKSEVKKVINETAIRKDSIYYKIYHSALAVQKGDHEGIRELVKLTFEEKPEELTSAIVKSITLGMLSFQSKSTNAYIIKVNSVFVDNAFLSFLDEEPFLVNKKLNKAILRSEYLKALQYVVDLTPKLADEADVYIGVELDDTVLAKVAKVREAQRAKEAAEKARLKAEREAELAKLQEKRKKPKVKKINQNGRTIIVTEVETTDGSSNENLNYAVFEFDNFYKVQQKRTGSSIYEKVYAKYEAGRAILYMDVSDEFQNSGKGYKEQILEGCYQFFKLRSGANGAGGSVDVKMMHNGEVVAGTKKGKIYFK